MINSTRLYAIFIIGCSALFSMNLGLNLFFHLTHLEPVHWGITGKWVLHVLHGQFFSPGITNEPSFFYEWILGLFTHITVGFLFATFYYFLTLHYFRGWPALYSGIVCSLGLSVFSYLMELPSMGLGIFGINSSHPLTTFIQTFMTHIFFGIGLGVGYVCADKLLKVDS